MEPRRTAIGALARKAGLHHRKTGGKAVILVMSVVLEPPPAVDHQAKNAAELLMVGNFRKTVMVVAAGHPVLATPATPEIRSPIR